MVGGGSGIVDSSWLTYYKKKNVNTGQKSMKKTCMKKRHESMKKRHESMKKDMRAWKLSIVLKAQRSIVLAKNKENGDTI